MDTENCHVCNADTPYPSVSHESVPSLIDNLTYALYGLITKTVVSGRVNWTIPCDPNSTASIWGYTRNAGEGLMCYFLRVFQNTNPGVWPDGIAGQFLTSLGGGAVAWTNTAVSAATTSVLGGFKLASSGSDVSISTASILALSTTGVAAGTFGSPTQWPVITVDTKGRLTGASVQSIAITSAQISGISASQVGAGLTSAQISGLSAAQVGAGLTSAQITGISAYQVGSGLTSAQINSISASAFPLSGATAATYGSAGTHPVLAINANGIITGATNQVISIGASQVLAGLTSAQIVGLSAAQIGTGITSAQISGLSAAQVGTGLTSAQISGIPASALPASGVAAATYGSAGTHPTISINANGIITGATNQIISIGASQVLPGLTSAQINSISTTAIPAVGVAGIYGNNFTIPQITVDTIGRVTSVSSATVQIGVGQISSLGTGVGTFLTTPTSANLLAAVTDETGTGTIVFSTSPIIATPTINGYTEGVVPLTITGGTAVLSITAGTVITATLLNGVSTVFTMPPLAAGKSFSLYLKQVSTGTPGSATFTSVKWPSAAAPTITTTNSSMDILSFVSDGTNWYGSFLQNFV